MGKRNGKRGKNGFLEEVFRKENRAGTVWNAGTAKKIKVLGGEVPGNLIDGKEIASKWERNTHWRNKGLWTVVNNSYAKSLQLVQI